MLHTNNLHIVLSAGWVKVEEGHNIQLIKILHPKGERIDVDKAIKDMNQEERAVLIASKMNLI